MKTKLLFISIALYCTASTTNSLTLTIDGRWLVDSAQITKAKDEIQDNRLVK